MTTQDLKANIARTLGISKHTPEIDTVMGLIGSYLIDKHPDNQADLINFVDDPKNIAKAVEGSMEKRSQLIDNQPSYWLDEAESLFAQGKSAAACNLIEKHIAEVEQAARVDEVQQIQRKHDSRLPTEPYCSVAKELLTERIATLRGEQP